MSAADRWRVVVFSGCGHGVIAQTLRYTRGSRWSPWLTTTTAPSSSTGATRAWPGASASPTAATSRRPSGGFDRRWPASLRRSSGLPISACGPPPPASTSSKTSRWRRASRSVDRIVAAVERADVRYALWNRNTFPAIEHTRRLLAAGTIGEPTAIHVDFYFAKDAGVLIDSDEPEEVPADWRGHGELTVEGIYPLAYIRHLLGVEVQRVFARTTSHFFRKYADRGLEDLATVTLELERGIVGSLCIGRIGRASHANLGELKLHIMGSAGSLVVSEPRPEVAVYTRGLAPSDYRHRRIGVYYERRLLDDFARAIDTGSDTLLDARAGRAIVATVNAALESGRTGRAVRIPGPVPWLARDRTTARP